MDGGSNEERSVADKEAGTTDTDSQRQFGTALIASKLSNCKIYSIEGIFLSSLLGVQVHRFISISVGEEIRLFWEAVLPF
jgi:hypothetical protein